MLDTYGKGGTVFVAVHGLGDHRHTWRHLGALLAERGHQMLAPDLPGHGDRIDAAATCTPEGIAADVVSLLEERDLHDVVLVGNSIGGAAIALASLLAPARVKALGYLNPFVRDMPADRWLRPLVPLLFARPWGRWAWMQYRRTLFTSPPADQAEADQRVMDSLADPRRLAAVRAMIRASKQGVAARLPELHLPSLVLMGATDPDYTDPTAEADTLASLLGDVREALVLPDCGHYPQVEATEATADALLRLAGYPPAR